MERGVWGWMSADGDSYVYGGGYVGEIECGFEGVEGFEGGEKGELKAALGVAKGVGIGGRRRTCWPDETVFRKWHERDVRW